MRWSAHSSAEALRQSSMIVIATLMLAGCGGVRAATAAQTACAKEALVISNEKSGPGGRTWTAQCQDRTYACSAPKSGKNSGNASCAEQLPSDGAGVATDTGGGCTYDAQCKGDRICQDGQCVAPSSGSADAAAAKPAAADGQGATQDGVKPATD